LHPDVNYGLQSNVCKNTESTTFVSLVAAYEVLRDPKRRMEYDELQRIGKDARSAQVSNPHCSGKGSKRYAAREYSVPDVDKEADAWLTWLYNEIGGRSSLQGNALARFCESSVRSALIEAYLGPWAVPELGFPSCFEAEERNPNMLFVEDVLQLVSGRQLLGSVRAVRPERLEGPRAVASLPHPGPGPPSVAGGSPREGAGLPCRRGTLPPQEPPLEVLFAGSRVGYAVRSAAGTPAALAEKAHGDLRTLPEAAVSGGVLVQDVVSVWHRPRHEPGEPADGGLELAARVVGLRDRGAGAEALQPALVTAFGREFRHADVFDPEGRLTHTVVAHRTLGVRSLTWMQGRLGRVECRCTRAWLPPSALWLFRPRAETHDTGP